MRSRTAIPIILVALAAFGIGRVASAYADHHADARGVNHVAVEARGGGGHGPGGGGRHGGSETPKTKKMPNEARPNQPRTPDGRYDGP
jgi:hypothetical protein